MTIGQRIKIRREELNMSQDDLAKRLDISHGHQSIKSNWTCIL